MRHFAAPPARQARSPLLDGDSERRVSRRGGRLVHKLEVRLVGQRGGIGVLLLLLLIDQPREVREAERVYRLLSDGRVGNTQTPRSDREQLLGSHERIECVWRRLLHLLQGRRRRSGKRL